MSSFLKFIKELIPEATAREQELMAKAINSWFYGGKIELRKHHGHKWCTYPTNACTCLPMHEAS